MSAIITRRGLVGGLGALFAAPAIVRASSIMPIRAIKPHDYLLESSNIEYGLLRTSYFEYVEHISIQIIACDARMLLESSNEFIQHIMRQREAGIPL